MESFLIVLKIKIKKVKFIYKALNSKFRDADNKQKNYINNNEKYSGIIICGWDIQVTLNGWISGGESSMNWRWAQRLIIFF